MELDPVLIIVVIGSVGGLLIERVFYYKAKYGERKKAKDCCPPPNPGPKPENPSHGERISSLETDVENFRESNKDDHELIRKSIDKLSGRINGVLNK